MTPRVLATIALSIVSLGVCLVAAGPFSAEWSAAITFDPDGALVRGVESAVGLRYETGPLVWTSHSDFLLAVGYLWQEFGVRGRLGALAVRGDVLFGPSTRDFLYAQAMAELRLAGADVGLYCACVRDAVFGGPADGFAVRVAASFAGLDVVLVTEMGARIEDDDFDGIDIVHASTGFYRHYVTDPIVEGRGFTGEKLSVSGLSFGCVGHAKAALYLACGGCDFVSFELEDGPLGVSWLRFDLEVIYHVQTKSLAVTPGVVVADGLVCLTPYFGLDLGAKGSEIEGVELGGLAVSCTWNGVTIRDLTVFDPRRFVITTDEFGSEVETLKDAIEAGHDFYAKYWELLSIEVAFDGCGGGTNRMLIHSYFGDEGGVFGWGMSYVKACVPITSGVELSGCMAVTLEGLEAVAVGVALRW